MPDAGEVELLWTGDAEAAEAKPCAGLNVGDWRVTGSKTWLCISARPLP